VTEFAVSAGMARAGRNLAAQACRRFGGLALLTPIL